MLVMLMKKKKEKKKSPLTDWDLWATSSFFCVQSSPSRLPVCVPACPALFAVVQQAQTCSKIFDRKDDFAEVRSSEPALI